MTEAAPLAAAAAVDPLWTWIAAACSSTLFAHAAITKLADVALFEQQLAAYGVPAALLTPLARGLPLLEALAALLLLSPWHAGGAALAASLLLLYGAAMAWHRARGATLDCGCGGEPLPVSWALVARNVALAALAGLAAAPAAARAMAWPDFLVVVAAVLIGTLLHAALHQVLRHRAGPPARSTLRRT
jgi:hypothetical protein